ncbi:MAG TPA: Na+/H+ antiporter subunit E [Stellaceae bacterium]|nr:Na+/H+ antiporter subunit E [Stellaceae bacterium]
MKRWLPYPFVSLALAALWLLLEGSAAPVDWLLAAALGAGGGLLLARLEPPRGRAKRRLRPALELAWLVLADIVRSNIAVARIVLNPRVHGRHAGFLALPLEARHPAALATLACIVTATPGTSWAGYDAERNVVTIHVLDLIDDAAWVRQFKERYERRILEIFP